MTDAEAPAPKQNTLQRIDKGCSRVFTTEPKLRRIVWHKQQTVRNRVYALQESFYPTTDVRYEAVKTRMATLLGIVDRASVLAYLGRPEHRTEQVVSHTKKYDSGKTVPITHYLRRKLAAKKGYIELFGAGYVYLINGEWWIHWNHTTQLTLPESEEVKAKSSKVDFSLSYNTPKGNKQSTPNNQCEHGSRVSERRERVSVGERNCESESNQQFSIVQHSEKMKVSKVCISNGPAHKTYLDPNSNSMLKTSFFPKVKKIVNT